MDFEVFQWRQLIIQEFIKDSELGGVAQDPVCVHGPLKT